MRDKRWFKLAGSLLVSALCVGMLAGCGAGNQKTSGEATTAAATEAAAEATTAAPIDESLEFTEEDYAKMQEEVKGMLSDEEKAALMEQVAASELELEYKDYLPDQGFADCEIFGIDGQGDDATMYAELCTGEYVKLKDKAYYMSGGQGDVIIKYEYAPDGPKVKEIIHADDGEEYEKWVGENFPKSAYQCRNMYNGYDENGNSILEAQLRKKAEEAFGVPVETENLLTIDVDAGTYEIDKTIETGDPASGDYKFDVENLEKGKLSDLK